MQVNKIKQIQQYFIQKDFYNPSFSNITVGKMIELTYLVSKSKLKKQVFKGNCIRFKKTKSYYSFTLRTLISTITVEQSFIKQSPLLLFIKIF